MTNELTAGQEMRVGQRVIVRDDATPFPVVYTNSVQVATSIYDFALDIGVVENVSEDGTVTVRLMQRLMMAPAHAKILARVLTENIAIYEKVWGVIPQASIMGEPTIAGEPPAQSAAGAPSR